VKAIELNSDVRRATCFSLIVQVQFWLDIVSLQGHARSSRESTAGSLHRLMTRMLTRMGHKVDTVENGELALEMISGESRATRTEPILENGEASRPGSRLGTQQWDLALIGLHGVDN